MTSRFLLPCAWAVTVLAAIPAHAVDINQCSMVADDRAEVIGFGGQMADGTDVELKGILASPDGSGPFPAVVMLPGGGGLYIPYCYGAVVEQFVSWGFVTLIVASTTARDRDGNQLSQYSFVDQARHAYAGASAVANVPRVDATRIGLWGHSRGGSGVIDAVSSAKLKPSTAFRAAVAAAPHCPAKAIALTVPLLVLIGAEDTDVSVDACIDFAAHMENISGFDFLLMPDAHHVYWAKGTRGFNEAAATMAANHLKTFLVKHIEEPH